MQYNTVYKYRLPRTLEAKKLCSVLILKHRFVQLYLLSKFDDKLSWSVGDKYVEIEQQMQNFQR